MGLKLPTCTRPLHMCGQKCEDPLASIATMYKAARTTAVNKRGTMRQDEEVNALLAVWGEEDIQAKLDGVTRNIKVLEAIAQRLHDFGFEGRTAVQCREKIKKLKGDYRKIKAHNNKSGRNCKTSKYMEQLDSILGHRPATESPVVLQSTQQETNPEDDPDKPTEEDPLDISAGSFHEA